MIDVSSFVRKNSNISERKFLGRLLSLLTPPIRISTIEWAETYRILTSEESFITGKFDCDRIPSMEYIYDCLDNKYIYIVVVMKASQVGWSELTNNYLGKLIHTAPCKIQWVFPGREPSRIYSREKLKPFFDNTKVLRDIINIGVAKESFNYFKFPGGFLKLTTAGAISNAKTSSISHIGVEEPDDVKDDVKGQGDTLDLYKGRQKSFPIGYKKLLFGGTPTDKDFSRVDNAYSESNKLVFKAECHHCKELSELSTDNIHYLEYADRFIHEEYGKDDPETAYYACPHCNGHWTFEEKNANIRAGKKYGFTDFTGNFSKGWHPSRPEITETFGFQVPELLSTLSNSDFVAIARKKILAERAKAKGNEGLMKSFVNNTDGKAYASGITALEVEDMIKLRKNYKEGVAPMDSLELTAGIDVQDNRFAIVINGYGRRDNIYLVLWKEIFGKITLQEWDEDNRRFKGVWGELTDLLINNPIMHASGKEMYISAISIDSGDNTELVYKWVLYANQLLAEKNRPSHVFATKGVRDLRYSEDAIYAEPSVVEAERDKQVRKSLAESMGVTLFQLGAHRAHEEILLRLLRNTIPDARSNVYYFNEQSYGQFEAQMLSCRKIIDTNSNYNRAVYKLIPGKRKEAMDAAKNSLHAAYAIGIRNFTNDDWLARERYYYDL